VAVARMMEVVPGASSSAKPATEGVAIGTGASSRLA
jgi:hypothetical protein